LENPLPSPVPPIPPTPSIPPAGAPPRPFWHPVARSGLYLLVYIFIEIVLSVLFGVAANLLEDSAFREGGIGQAPELLLLAVAFQIPPVLGVTWLFVRYLDRRNLASLGARWPAEGALRELFTMPLGVLALLGSWVLLILALPAALGALRFGGLSAAFSNGPAWWPLPPVLLLAALLILFLLQGGLEEWIVRGYIYRALKERWRPFWAALASSVLFSLLHALNPNVSAIALFNIILAGLVLAALVERSGSLWGATIAHGFWNFAVACLLSLPVSGIRLFHLLDVSLSGDERLTGGSFGPEGSLLLTLLGLGLTVVLWRRLPDRPRKGIAPSTPEDVLESIPL
jgi:membrane protease YdiL (CAAX protease family)